MKKKKTLLLTNDDGFLSPGLRQLQELLARNYNVYVVAPDGERSAISMSLTLNRPLRIHQLGPQEFAIDGTPVDCINIALDKLLPHPPDFVISGMNLGENLSEDVYFSGTVGGAFAAHLYGVPSMAVSLLPGTKKQHPDEPVPTGYNSSASHIYDFVSGALITQEIIEILFANPALLQLGVVFNVNIPYNHSHQIIIASQGLKHYVPDVIENTDPRGRKYFWFGQGNPLSHGEEGSDIDAVKNGHIALTALKYDLNAPKEMELIRQVFSKKKPGPVD